MKFHSPTAVAASQDYIYVVDAGNTCVHIINKDKDNGSSIDPIRLRNAEPKGIVQLFISYFINSIKKISAILNAITESSSNSF